MKTKLLPFAACVLLAGCRVGPDYQPPAVKLPEQWGEPLSGCATGQVNRVSAWWKSFNDAELDALIERAAATNLNLRIAEARVRQSRAQRGLAQADLWPSIDGSGSYSRQRQSENQPILGDISIPSTVPFENNVYQAGFDAAWELDLFGGKHRAIEAADADLVAVEYERHEVLVTLLSEVARHYVVIRGAQRQLAVLQSQIAAQAETLTITENRVKIGAATELDAQRAAALLATIQSQVPPLETTVQTAIHRLGVLLDLHPDALRDELSVTKPLPPVPPEVPVGLPSDLILHRPDVRKAERRLAADTARIGQVKSELFPKFFLTGAVGQSSAGAGDFFSSSSRTWSIGPSVQWRIFDFGRVRSQIRAQIAVQDQASLSYEQVILNSLEEVENALVAYAKEQEHRRLLAQAVSAHQKAVELANEQYNEGLGNYLDLLDTQRALYVAQGDLAQSERTVAVNLIMLYKALGGGWDNSVAQ